MIDLLKKRKRKFILYLIASTFPVITDMLRVGLFALLFHIIEIKDKELFYTTVMLGGVVIILSIILYVSSRMLRISFMRDTLLDVRVNAFEKIINTSYLQFSKKSKDIYISNLVNDINTFETSFFLNFLNVLYRGFLYIVSLILLFIIDYRVGAVMFLISVIIFFLIKAFQAKTVQLQKNVSTKNEELTLNLANTFNGLEILKLNSIEEKFSHKTFENINKVEKSKFNFRFFSESQRSVTNILGFLIFIGLMLYLITRESLDYAKIMITLQLSMMMVFALPDIFPRFNVVKSGAEIYRKITVLDEAADKNNKHHQFLFTDKIEVKNLTFAYDTKQVFKNACFTIEKGKKYLIKGPSGIGKSTLIKLLSQTYDNYEGEILVDGINLKSIKTKSLSDKIGFIYQDVFLFEDNIKNNIALFKNINPETINKAIKLSGLEEFMNNKTLDTKIEENGKNLSGGEKQRISIARGIAKEAEILFIDEGTSALNEELGSEIENSILNLNTTIIAISHRYYPGISEKYDYILEIDNGEINTYKGSEYFQMEAKYV